MEALYNKSSSAGLTSNDTFETTVGVWQGSILAPCLFNICLEQIMMESLDSFEGTITVGGTTITNLTFADDIGLLAWSTDELDKLTR